MNKQILLSLGTLVVAGAVIAGGTGAFFSDTETSVGNVFTSGSVSIDLLSIDHEYFGNDPIPANYFETGTASNVPFFKFNDLKPGDTGMIEKELVNGANDAYMCAKNTLVADDAPFIDKLKLRVNTGNGITAGQFYTAPFDEWYTLDTTNPTNPGGQGLAVDAGDTVIANLEYCLGDFVAGVPGAPGSAGTSCVVDTAYDWNPLQNQEIRVDVEYYAVQQRNNGDFTCGSLNDDVVVRPAVGAFAFAYATPEPSSCDLTVDGIGTGADEYVTLAAAEAAATANQTICVDQGIYEEDVTVDVAGLTILGLNDPKGASKATLDGQLTIAVDGVTVSGLEITNPDAGYAVLVQGVNNTEISDNSIVNVGTTLPSGSAQAIYYDGAAVAASGLTIDGNTIVGVGSLSKTGNGGSKGIFIGDSTSPMALNGVIITDNVISDIKTLSATGGKGSYGILINYGVNSTGSVVGSTITNNTVFNLEGRWSHAIGLETNTPNASVTKNDISDVLDGQGGVDAIGVFFEGNAGGSTTVVNENNFASDIGAFAVAVHPASPAITVDAEDNWWGDVTPADESAAPAGSTIDFDPFETSAFPTN